jgi:hypothetical protein
VHPSEFSQIIASLVNGNAPRLTVLQLIDTHLEPSVEKLAVGDIESTMQGILPPERKNQADLTSSINANNPSMPE